MSNNLEQDQVRDIVRPSLGSNCFQRLSADDPVVTCKKKLNQVTSIQIFRTFVVGRVGMVKD